MTTQQALTLFREKSKASHALFHAIGLLNLDGMTVAPRASAKGRGETLEYLSGLYYEVMTGEDRIEAAKFLQAHPDDLDAQTRREVELFLRDVEYVSSIPQEEYVAYTALLNEADAVWHRAKVENDFPAFAPYIQKIFDTNRRFAGYYKPNEDPFNVQIGMYERGLTVERLDAFFAALREKIVPLLRRVQAAAQVDDSFLHGKNFPTWAQRNFSKFLMDVLTIDPDCCTIGETEHPFTESFNKRDVRITTHYYEDSVLSSMYSVIHEGGHALYELHTADELEGTELGQGASMSLHESQSRLFENLIGRSRGFMKVILPKMKELFPAQMEGVTEEMLYRAANKAEPSLIRTEADELTYALHVMVRYEIEKGLFAGTVTANDLPRVWNEKFREYLGIEVPDDRRGVLQDGHWAGGNVGYFPSYALGSAYGAQIIAKMRETVDVDAAIASGDLHPVTAWLEEHLWRFGSMYDPMETFERCCGAPFDPAYFTDYLEKKYTELYQLS